MTLGKKAGGRWTFKKKSKTPKLDENVYSLGLYKSTGHVTMHILVSKLLYCTNGSKHTMEGK